MLDNDFTTQKAPDRSLTGLYHCCGLLSLEERFYLLCKEVHSLKWQEVKEPEQGLLV